MNSQKKNNFILNIAKTASVSFLAAFIIFGSAGFDNLKLEFSSALAAKGGNGGGNGGGKGGGNSNAKNDNAGKGNNNAGNASARAKEVANARSAVGKAATAEAKELAEKELAILEYELALQGLRLTDDLEVVNWNVEVPEQPPEGYEDTSGTATEDTTDTATTAQ